MRSDSCGGKRTGWGLFFVSALLFSVCGCSTAPDVQKSEVEPQEPAVIESVSFTSGPETAAVTVKTSRKAAHKKPFSLLQPPRIYVDIKGVPNEVLPNLLKSDEGFIKEIRIQKQRLGYTGIIVYLRHPNYTSTLRTQGSQTVLQINATQPSAKMVPKAPSPQAAKPDMPKVLGVKVAQREGNRTRLTINTEEAVDYDVKLDRQTLIIELKNGTISPDMLKQLESEYDQGAVARINAFYAPKDETVTLRVALRELIPYHLTQEAGVLNVDFDPLPYSPATAPAQVAGTPKPAAPARDRVVAQAPAQPPSTSPSRPARAVAPKRKAKQPPVPESTEKAGNAPGESRAKLFEDTAKQYAGERMSFDFVDTDIRNILKLIAEVANINIVWGADVEGKISMRLDNVPWDQALEMVLRPNGLSYQIEDDVLWVVPRQKLVDMEISEKKRKGALLAEKRLQGIFEAKIIEFITIKYRTAGEIFRMLVGDPSATPPVHPILDIEMAESEEKEEGEEEKGKKIKIATKDLYLSYDDGTNTIIANGVRAKVDKVKQLIAKLDIPRKQVMIEARIVEATTDFSRDLGIQWQSLDGTEPGISREWYNKGANFEGSSQFSTNAPSNWSPNIGLAFGWLTDGGLGSLALDASLALGETDGNVQILSAPKVLTVNGSEALISRGVVDYFPVRTEDTIAIEEVPALLELTVTPQVSADNSHVTMNVVVTDNKTKPAERTEVEGAVYESQPGRTEKKITSTLIVRTGETVVIGGIYQKEESVSDTGVPWIKDIPLLGWLFKAERTTKNKVELLIFITPSVVNPDQKAGA